MCFACFIQNPIQKSKIQFIIGFNRQERVERMSLPFGQFNDDSNIFAGKDIHSGGTWLGINIQTGILVFLTNYRVYEHPGHSRGNLLHQILHTNFIPKNEYANSEKIITEKLIQILNKKKQYYPFNLIIYDSRFQKIYYICTRSEMKFPKILEKKNIYCLCNTDINTKWARGQYARKIIQNILKDKNQETQADQIIDSIQKLLQNTDRFETNKYPYQKEESMFIQPYQNQFIKEVVMTLSSFIALFEDYGDHILLTFKQITYKQNLEKSQVHGILKIMK